jgi:hypothetical protein
LGKSDDIDCKKYRPDHEYSHLHEFVDNVPYIMMTLLGAAIFFMGIKGVLWGYITAASYILYGIVGTLWIIVFVCPYCHYFDTRACPCGYGQIAAKLRAKKDDSLFRKKFKKHIPVIVPLWIIPVVAGIVFLVSSFSFFMLTLIALFAINSFIVLPLVSTKYGCAHCPQKDTCPWMGGKK